MVMTSPSTIKLDKFERLFVIDLLNDEINHMRAKECGFEDDWLENENGIKVLEGIIRKLQK